MTKNTKALVYNFIGFAGLYLVTYFAIKYFLTNITGVWIPVCSAVVATLLAPKFQAVKTNTGEKIYMKWFLKKGVKEVG
jgi:hypothetical protein